MEDSMADKKIQKIAWELAEPIVTEKGFELVDVEYVKEGAGWYLRVYIDKPGGITIDDCQAVSEQLSDRLDRYDPIKQSYFLEVSSPGLERPLKTERDFERYKGEDVEVRTFEPINGSRVFEGKLAGLRNDDIVIMQENGEEMVFNRKKVALVKRTIKF